MYATTLRFVVFVKRNMGFESQQHFDWCHFWLGAKFWDLSLCHIWLCSFKKWLFCDEFLRNWLIHPQAWLSWKVFKKFQQGINKRDKCGFTISVILFTFYAHLMVGMCPSSKNCCELPNFELWLFNLAKGNFHAFRGFWRNSKLWAIFLVDITDAA